MTEKASEIAISGRRCPVCGCLLYDEDYCSYCRAVSHYQYQVLWDPVTGCDRTSPGCKNCYAHTYALQLKDLGLLTYRNGFNTTIHEDALTRLKYFDESPGPAIITVCTNADLFNPKVPDDFIKRVVETMWEHPNCFFISSSTKYIEIPMRLNLEFPPNYVFTVTVEHSDFLWRAKLLREIKAVHKSILVAPILSSIPDLHLYLDGVCRVQVYEERSDNPRPVDPAWIDEIAEQCEQAGVEFVNTYRQHLVSTFKRHLFGLIFQLIERTPGLTTIPTPSHPKVNEYVRLLGEMKQLTLREIGDKVRQVAPELFTAKEEPCPLK